MNRLRDLLKNRGAQPAAPDKEQPADPKRCRCGGTFDEERPSDVGAIIFRGVLLVCDACGLMKEGD